MGWGVGGVPAHPQALQSLLLEPASVSFGCESSLWSFFAEAPLVGTRSP